MTRDEDDRRTDWLPSLGAILPWFPYTLDVLGHGVFRQA